MYSHNAYTIMYMYIHSQSGLDLGMDRLVSAGFRMSEWMCGGTTKMTGVTMEYTGFCCLRKLRQGD